MLSGTHLEGVRFNERWGGKGSEQASRGTPDGLRARGGRSQPRGCQREHTTNYIRMNESFSGRNPQSKRLVPVGVASLLESGFIKISTKKKSFP